MVVMEGNPAMRVLNSVAPPISVCILICNVFYQDDDSLGAGEEYCADS